MPSLKHNLLCLGLGLLPSFACTAGPNCTGEPKDKWMPESEMKAKVDSMGYKVKVFKTSGTCYEIYGHDKDGKKVEIYFNPVDGSIVKQREG